MDDEFKLCWKNFQDNIASGFQSLYDRGDLVDVTLACDGKLLQAHKIVLAICSPYFQEIFITNPCKHPIIILKDVSYTIMCELLEFMYQGVVNVKHTELQAFMKIGQLLQIKGLATNSSTSTSSSSADRINLNHNTSAEAETATQPPNSTPKTPPPPNDGDNNSDRSKQSEKPPNVQTNSNSNTPQRSQSPAPSPASPSLNISNDNAKSNDSQPYHLGGGGSASGSVSSHKRQMAADFNTDALSIYSRNKIRRSLAPTDHSSENNDGSEMGGNGSMDQMNAEDFFLPHITMSEPRYDLSTVKRDDRSEHHSHPSGSSAAAAAAAAASLRNSFNPSAFGLDYTFYKNGGPPSTSGGPEYPNDLNPSGDFGKGFANHMDIPPIGPGEHWFQGKLEFMLSQRGKPLLVHDGHTFGIQYVRKDKKYWQCNLSRKFNCKARVTTTDTGEIIVTNNEHCHTEIRQHLRKDYQRNKVMMNALINLSTNRLAVDNLRRHNMNSIASNLSSLQTMVAAAASSSPLAMQSHVGSKAAAMNAMAGTLLDLGKRSASMEEQDFKFSNHHPYQQQSQEMFSNHHHHHHQHHHHQSSSHEEEHQNLNDMNDDNESVQDEQPLDCGVRSSLERERYEPHSSGKSVRQEYIEDYSNTAAAAAAAAAAHQLQSSTSMTSNNSNNNCNDTSEWQSKNETIQQ